MTIPVADLQILVRSAWAVEDTVEKLVQAEFGQLGISSGTRRGLFSILAHVRAQVRIIII